MDGDGEGPPLRLAEESDVARDEERERARDEERERARTVTINRGLLWQFVQRYADTTPAADGCGRANCPRRPADGCRGQTSDPHRFPDCPAAEECLDMPRSPLFDFSEERCLWMLWKKLTGEELEL